MNYPEWVTYFPLSASCCHNTNQMFTIKSNLLLTNSIENKRFPFWMKHFEILSDPVTSKCKKMFGKEKRLVWLVRVWLTIFLQTSFDLGKRQNTFLFDGCSQPQRMWVLFLPGSPSAPWGGCVKPLSELWCLHGLWGQHAPTASCRV